MSDRAERRIRQLMAEIRSQDRDLTPGFAETLQASREHPQSQRRWSWLMPVPVAIAAGILLMVLFGPWRPTPSPQAELVEAGALADWTSPSTAFLGLGGELSDDDDLPDEQDVLAGGGWGLPSDVLMQQADEIFRQEM